MTGYVFDMKELSNIIKIKVEKRLDHKNLNLDVRAGSGFDQILKTRSENPDSTLFWKPNPDPT